MKSARLLSILLGGLAEPLLVRRISYVLLFLLAGPATATSAGQWIPLGPEGGNAVALAVASGGVVWAATASDGGLFRSANGGASWQRTGGDLARSTILTVTVDPVRPVIVYAGTASGGIYRSTNGGFTWTTVNQGLHSFHGSYPGVRILQVNPRAPRQVFAATDSGLYRSRDRGALWEKLLPYYIEAFAIAPSDPRFLYVVGSGGAFRSTNGGLTWAPMGGGLDDLYISALTVDPMAPESVWAAALPRYESEPGLLHSRDGGASWSRIELDGKFRSLLMDPRVPDTVWAGTDGGVVRLFDQGDRSQFFPVSAGEGVISLTMDRADSRILYAGTGWDARTTDGYPGRQGGVWRSADRGKTWQQVIRGMTATEVQAVAVPAPGRIVAAVLGRGPMIGNRRGFDWISGNQGIGRDIHDLLADPVNPGRLWAATTNGVFRSQDGGRTWTGASEGLLPYPWAPWLVYDALALDPSTSELWAAGWGGLFRSADGAKTWARAQGLREGLSIRSVAVDPTNPRRVWAIDGGGEWFPTVFRSADGGATWQETSFATLMLNGLAVGPSGTVFVGALSQLWRSKDFGATWQQASPSGIVAIAVDPIDPKTVYAGGYVGLYRSRDEGATWEAVPGAAGRAVIRDLAWESPGVLLVATRGMGLLRFVPED